MPLEAETTDGYPTWVVLEDGEYFLCSYDEPDWEIRIPLAQLVADLRKIGLLD